MTTSEHYIADLSDILAVRIVCNGCGTGTSFDPAQWKGTSGTCQNCKTTLFMDGATGIPIDQLRITLDTWLKAKTGTLPYNIQIELSRPK